MNTSIKTMTPDKLERVAHILKTIAHPIKLEIILFLAENEPADVSSICEAMSKGCQISMMSHHLNKLKDNGVVCSEKIGKQVFYEIVDKQILNLFSCMEKCSMI